MFVTTNLTTYLTTSPSHHLNITACTSSTAALAASTTPSASQASSATFLTTFAAAYRPKNSQNVLSEKPSHHRVAATADKYVC